MRSKRSSSSARSSTFSIRSFLEVKPRDDGDQSTLAIEASPDGLSRWRRALGARANRNERVAIQRDRSAERKALTAGTDKHCGAGSNNLTVDSDGRAPPCVQWRVPVGNLHEQRVTEIGWLGDAPGRSLYDEGCPPQARRAGGRRPPFEFPSRSRAHALGRPACYLPGCRAEDGGGGSRARPTYGTVATRNTVERTKNTSTSEATEREPYETPCVVYREPLEAVATSCTPAPRPRAPSACVFRVPSPPERGMERAICAVTPGGFVERAPGRRSMRLGAANH